MKKIYSFIFFGILCLHASAQTVIIGAGAQNGTSSNGATGDPGPIYKSSATSSFIYSRYHYLYTATELATAGLPPGSIITGVAWYLDNNAGMNTNFQMEIWLENSALTTVQTPPQTWAALTTTATQVYNSNSTFFGPTNGWLQFNSSSFVYTGGALEISVSSDMSQGSSPWTTAGFSWKKDPITGRTISYCGSSPNTTLGNARTVRPQLRITYIPGTPCSGQPTAGTVTGPSSQVCPLTPFGVSLTGTTLASGISIQWQSRPGTSGPWTNIPGATNAAETFTASVTSQYRAYAVCSASSLADTSLPVTVTVASLFPGGTYTINSGSITGGTNFQSFTDAVNAISCGISGPIVFNVVTGSGPYNEQVTIPAIATTSAVNTITFNGNGETLSFNSANSGERAVFKLDGTDYVTINNLNIVAPGTTTSNYGFGIQLMNDADNNTINNCTVNTGVGNTSSNYAGIVVGAAGTGATTAGSGDCDSNTISGCTVMGGYYGITMIGNSTTSAMYNNKILNNTIVDQYAYHCYNLGCTGTLIQGNDISRPTRTSHTTFYGILLTTGCKANLVNANKIHNPFDGLTTSTSTVYGLYCAADATVSDPNIFSNNALYNLNGNGTQYNIYNTGAQYAYYYYNTINSDYASTAGTTYGFYQVTAVPGIEIRNNIFSISRGGTGTKYCIYFSTAAATFTGDRNDYYMGSTAGTNNLGYYAGSARATLALWQTATSQDANSVSVDPVFASAVTGNLNPTVATGLDNLGLPIAGITTDITGATRSVTTPDLGAFEWTPPTCLQPTGLNATAITATGATLGWTAVAGAAGYEWMVTTSATPPATGTPIGAVTTVPSGTLTPSTFYYFHIRANCGANGYSYWSSIQFTTPPVNDDCPNSINISNSLPTAGSTIGGTQTMSNASCAVASTTTVPNDVWYHFTTTSIGDVVVTATTTTGDVVLEVFSGTCGTFTSLGCVDAPAIGTEIITLPALAPGTYYVRIFGYLSAQTTFTVQVLINGFPLSTNEVNISAVNKGSYNQVNWNITSDVKYTSFDLERSGDGERFTQIATVAANEGNEYAYNDNKPLTGINYYRIKTVDRSGKASYSKVVFTSVKDADLFTAEAYPNPVQDKLTVKVYGNQGDKAQVVITDIAGKLMRQVSVTGNETIIDMNGIDQGIYFLKYKDSLHDQTIRISKQ